MSVYAKMRKISKAGAVDSKYFGNLNAIDRDVFEKIQNTEEFKEKLRDLILNDPNKIEQRYHNCIEVLLELKKRFEL